MKNLMLCAEFALIKDGEFFANRASGTKIPF